MWRMILILGLYNLITCLYLEECGVCSLWSLIKALKIKLISREELFFLQPTPFAWIVWQLHWYLYVLYTALSGLWMNTTALYCNEYILQSKCIQSMGKWFVWMPRHKQWHTQHLRRGKGLCWPLWYCSGCEGKIEVSTAGERYHVP